jgi:acyl-CoA thioesterase YciA
LHARLRRTATNPNYKSHPGAPPDITCKEPSMSSTVSQLPPGKAPQLRVMPMPSDANVYGDVFGGWIMAQVDIAGSLPATRRANGRVATIAVNSFLFKNPVFVGDLLSFYADIVKVGNTSITVNVEVCRAQSPADRDRQGDRSHLTYVATDENRKPRPLPPLDPVREAGASPAI